MDPIDRQTTINALHKKRIETMEKGQDVNLIWECLDVIAQVPSAQSEIIRCKDCKHNSLNRKSGNTYCNLGIGLYQLDDYCSYGERRKTNGI